MDSVTRNLQLVRQRIERACRHCRRDPSSVTLVGVTKGIPAETIQEAIACGITDLGENRVQEARAKRTELDTRLRAQGSGFGAVPQSPEPPAQSAAGRSPQQIRWHMIGHLQRNKARHAVELFDVIHSIDSMALIEELDRRASHLVQGSRFKVQGKEAQKTIEVLIQVNVSGEATKFGCRPEEVISLTRAIVGLQRLKLTGLMTMAPFSTDPENARPYFRRLRQLRDEVTVTLNLEPSAVSLSMGMSQDFEVAIEEGADLVRIGSAIFA